MQQKPQQVFVGCPFSRSIRKNYDRLKVELERECPVHIVLADTQAISSTDYLLEHITELISESSGCVFDATGGNANVSLEVGIAHTLPAEFILTMSTRKPRKPKRPAPASSARAHEVRPIISDLQGRNRIEYKTYASLKDQLTKRFFPKIPFMQRWENFKTENSTLVKYAVKVFQELRQSGRTRRPRVDALLNGSGLAPKVLLGALVKARLITVKRGRQGGIYYPLK